MVTTLKVVGAICGKTWAPDQLTYSWFGFSTEKWVGGWGSNLRAYLLYL